jgi:hypothetical protein
LALPQGDSWISRNLSAQPQADLQGVDERHHRAGGGADRELVADGGPEADGAAQRVALRKAATRQHNANCRFNQAGGGADKQLVADGGLGADGAAQRVDERHHRERQ